MLTVVMCIHFFSSRMIFTMMCGLLFGSDGYFVALAWSSCALMFFIVSASYGDNIYYIYKIWITGLF